MKQLFHDIVEEACPAGLHHSGFSCENHQPKVFFEIPEFRQLAAAFISGSDEGSSTQIFGWWFPQENPELFYDSWKMMCGTKTN